MGGREKKNRNEKDKEDNTPVNKKQKFPTGFPDWFSILKILSANISSLNLSDQIP